MAVPTPIIASWLFGGFINLLVMGAVLAIVYERVGKIKSTKLGKSTPSLTT